MKRHYWLISFDIREKGDNHKMDSVGQNTLSTNFTWLNENNIEGFRNLVLEEAHKGSVDGYVHIKSVSYLGEMTQEEWES